MSSPETRMPTIIVSPFPVCICARQLRLSSPTIYPYHLVHASRPQRLPYHISCWIFAIFLNLDRSRFVSHRQQLDFIRYGNWHIGDLSTSCGHDIGIANSHRLFLVLCDLLVAAVSWIGAYGTLNALLPLFDFGGNTAAMLEV